MTGADLYRARIELGRLWGFERAVFAAELGRALGNPSRDAGEIIRKYEARRGEPVPWFLATPVLMMLGGMLPPGGVPIRLYDRTVRRDRKSRRPAAPASPGANAPPSPQPPTRRL